MATTEIVGFTATRWEVWVEYYADEGGRDAMIDRATIGRVESNPNGTYSAYGMLGDLLGTFPASGRAKDALVRQHWAENSPREDVGDDGS